MWLFNRRRGGQGQCSASIVSQLYYLSFFNYALLVNINKNRVLMIELKANGLLTKILQFLR